MSESCRTRIPGWSNPILDWTDAVAFMCAGKDLGVPATSLGAPRITVEQSGRKNILFGNTAGECARKSYLLLIVHQFLKFMYSVCILIYVSMCLYSYSSIVLATVPDRHFGSGSGSELNRCQIGGPGCQYTRTVNSGLVRCNSPNPSELGRLSAGRPAGPSVDLYNVLVFAVG